METEFIEKQMAQIVREMKRQEGKMQKLRVLLIRAKSFLGTPTSEPLRDLIRDINKELM